MAGSPYEITCTAGTLAADNYGFETGEAGELEITKATLSIDADDKSKDYGASDPPFTYELSGFVNGEDEQSAGVTGEADCSREAGESVAGSPYEITCTAGTLAADNYGFETGEAGELDDHQGDALDRRRRQVEGLRRVRSALHLHAERLRQRRGRAERRRHGRGGLQP